MPAVSEARYVVMAGWDDVPHLKEDTKRKLLASTHPHLRDARSKGIPSLGSGALYPIADELITVAPFAIPDWWPRAYGFDVGWNMTAAVWLAQDPETGVIYAYAEHARGEAPPVIHAEAIKLRGPWMQGAIDPASRGRTQDDGKQLFAQYLDHGLNLVLADNSVEAGIQAIWGAFEAARLKIFTSCTGLLTEKRLYRRDEKGKVVKKQDHRLDALRYGYLRFREIAKVKPVFTSGQSWQPIDQSVGY